MRVAFSTRDELHLGLSQATEHFSPTLQLLQNYLPVHDYIIQIYQADGPAWTGENMVHPNSKVSGALHSTRHTGRRASFRTLRSRGQETQFTGSHFDYYSHNIALFFGNVDHPDRDDGEIILLSVGVVLERSSGI